MIYIEHKIINNYEKDDKYYIVTEDFGELFTKNIEEYLETIKDGFIELEHEDDFI